MPAWQACCQVVTPSQKTAIETGRRVCRRAISFKVKEHETMDKLSSVSRFVEAPPSLEQLPHQVLQQILHYLPVRIARNAFRLVNRNYLVGTDYLRIAGLAQARIRNKVASESRQQTESRFASLISDCMNSAFPVPLRSALVIELIGTLPQLPGALHAEAMRVVLAQCDTIDEHAGQATRHKCMARCIHAYQRRTELEPQLQTFRPSNDEEACIAAHYFVADFDHGTVPFIQVINHLTNLLAAMDSADTMNYSEQGDRALAILCDHCTELFAVLNGDAASLRKNAGWGQVAGLKKKFAAKATLLFPVRSMTCQAVLVSVVLDLSEPGSAMHKQAERDGRNLVAEIPDDMLFSNLIPLATRLFRKGVINTMIKRVEAWPVPDARLGMLRQLAIVAWERGAMDHMEHLCASICKLVPPDPVALQALMQANLQKGAFDRMEISTRDVIPYLLCVPPGLPRVAAIETLGIFSLAMPELNQGIKAQRRFLSLLNYSIRARTTLIRRYYSSNEAELERVADAAKSNNGRSPAGSSASSSAGLRANPTYVAAMQMLEQFKKQNAKPDY
jgi:hypothetical protein